VYLVHEKVKMNIPRKSSRKSCSFSRLSSPTTTPASNRGPSSPRFNTICHFLSLTQNIPRHNLTRIYISFDHIVSCRISNSLDQELFNLDFHTINRGLELRCFIGGNRARNDRTRHTTSTAQCDLAVIHWLQKKQQTAATRKRKGRRYEK
jgi:hypothetical protein